MYMDRIMAPKELTNLHKKDIKEIQPIKCNKCMEIVAMPYIYQKEKRHAFRVFKESVIKRLKK